MTHDSDMLVERRRLKRGARVTCTVAAILDNGIEVTVEGVTGFIRKSDLSRERTEQRPDRFAAGEKVDAKVTSVSRANRRVTLSIKALEIDDDKHAMAEYGSSESGASLGDILGAAMTKVRNKKAKDAADAEAPAEETAEATKAAAKAGKDEAQTDAADAKSDSADAADAADADAPAETTKAAAKAGKADAKSDAADAKSDAAGDDSEAKE